MSVFPLTAHLATRERLADPHVIACQLASLDEQRAISARRRALAERIAEAALSIVADEQRTQRRLRRERAEISRLEANHG